MGRLPVLFLPGTLCTGAIFSEQIATLGQLASQVDVVQFGQHHSLDEMAELVAERIPLESGAAIVGFSMGGIVAMALMRRRPESIRKLALLNTNHRGDLPQHDAERQKIVAEARTQGMEVVMEKYYVPLYFHNPEPTHHSLVIDMACELGVACFEAQAGALSGRPDSSATLQSIQCPTLVLGARQDKLCPPSLHVEMSRLVKGSQLVLLDDCGHFSTLERADEVNRALSAWYVGKL